MDGTLVRGAALLPGASEFLSEAHRRRKRVVVLTDNSTSSRQVVAQRLEASGVPMDAEYVVTSSHAVAAELHRMQGASRVYLIGESALADDLRSFGHTIVVAPPADAVVVGFTSRFGYETLVSALPVLASGAPLLATDEATVYAAPGGTRPGAGCIVGAFRGMGYDPRLVAGKPDGAAVDLSLELAAASTDRVALIGDSLRNDGGAAHHLGVDFVLILSGVSSREDAERTALHPAHILDSLADLGRGAVR